jgi:hypothetical protein
MPVDAPHGQVMPLRDIFFNLNPNITTTSMPRNMTRITTVDESDYFSKAPKTPQISILCTPVLSGSYDV